MKQFKKGDRVCITGCYDIHGSEGTIVGQEVWINRNTFVIWDGEGERPVYRDPIQQYDLWHKHPRWLVKVDKFVGYSPRALWWRKRCEETPHTYPLLSSYQMHMISKEVMI